MITQDNDNYFELMFKTLEEAQSESAIQSSAVDKLHHLINLLQVQHDELITANQELENENEQLQESLTKSEQARRELLNSEKNYRVLAEHYPNGMIGLYNHDLIYVLVGGKGLEDVGLSKEFFEGKRLRDVMPPEVYERDEPALLAALEGQTIKTTVPYNGRTYQVLTSPLFDDDVVAGGIIATHDITDYVLAENRFKTLFDAASIAILLINQDGSIAVANEKASDIFGYPKEELADANLELLLPVDTHTIHQQHMMAYFENPRPRTMGQGLDLLARRKDGSTFPIEVSLSSLDTENGKQAVAFVADITHRKQLEADLQTREAMYRTLIESLPSSIMILQDGQYVFCNMAGAKMMGYDSPDDIVDKETLAFIPPEYHAMLHQRLSNTKQGQANEPVEMTVLKKDGSEMIVESISIPIIHNGQPATMIFGYDLTERKQAQQQQIDLAVEREKVALLQSFMEDASHDFRTPLSTIISSIHILKHTIADADVLSRVDRVERQALHLKGLLEDIFTLLELEFQPTVEGVFIDLKPLLIECIQEYEAATTVKQQTMHITLPNEPVRVYADEENLRIAVNKVLENAVNYTPENGHIDVRLLADSDNVRIQIEDNGIGIAEDDLPQIFKRFFRADKSRNVATGSSGLGLSIVQRVLENHDGSVSVESSPEEGSVFTLVLPITHQDD